MDKTNQKTAGNVDLRQRGAWRPKPQKVVGAECPHCGGAVAVHDAVCLHCGRGLSPVRCSFCGGAMKPGAKFCTHCGQPREGVRCPACGTLNARNFCRRCNSPLTPSALKALEAAKQDPKFIQVQHKAKELASLLAQIQELQDGSRPEGAGPQLSEADQRLLDDYASVIASVGVPVPGSGRASAISPATAKPTDASAGMEGARSAVTAMSLADIMEAYKAKAAEMDAALAEMAPPPDFTPEQQRDYYSARKVAHLDREVPMLWKCNLCGCLHPCPADCARPELGGVWVTVSAQEYLSWGGSDLRPAKIIID